MKLFLDTANIQEIRDGARLGVISGVTTNPSLAASQGIGDTESYKTAVKEISELVEGPISVEVVSQDAAGMIAEGRDIAEWIPNPWVKIPSTLEGFEAISTLSREGIKINQTLLVIGKTEISNKFRLSVANSWLQIITLEITFIK